MKDIRVFRKIILMGFFLFTLFFAPHSQAATLPPGNISTCGTLAAAGTYTLTTNIGTAGQACLTITSSGVVINDGGNAYTVSGNIVANAVSLNTNGFNFNISGFVKSYGDISSLGNGSGVLGTTTFSGSSYNAGNITGNVAFTEQSYNYIIVDNNSYYAKYTFEGTGLADSSGNGNNLTRYTGALNDPAITSSVKKFGSQSGQYFGTLSRAFRTPTINWSALTGYTVEGWFYLTSAQAAGSNWPGVGLFVESTPSNGSISVLREASDGKLVAGQAMLNGGSASLTGVTPMTLNQWHHVALDWDGSTFRVFLDGNLEASTPASSIKNGRIQPLSLGALDPSNGGWTVPMTGYIDNVKIALNHALYTSNFTPLGTTWVISGSVAYNGFSGNNANGYYLLGNKTTLDSSGFGSWNGLLYNTGVPVSGVSISSNTITVDGVDFPYTYGDSNTVWNFRNGATNSGNITGSVNVYYSSPRPITGTVNGSINYLNYPGAGTYWYSTNGNTDWNDPLNWWLDINHTEQATYPPDVAKEVVLLGPTAPIVDLTSWIQPNSIDSSGLQDGGGIVFSGNGTVSTNITGNATFNTQVTNTGIVSGTGYFFNGSTNSGSVTTPVYLPFSSGKIWTNYSNDGDWNNKANWLGGVATTSDNIILLASLTLHHDVTNNFFILNEGITIDGTTNQYAITGNVTSADGVAGQDEDGSGRGVTNGYNGVSINLTNTSVIGTITSGIGGRGGNNYSWWGYGGTGGNGGSINVSGTNLDLSNKSISAGSGGAGGDDGCGGGCYGNGSIGSNGSLSITNTGISVLDVSRTPNLYLSALSNLTIIDNGTTHNFGSFAGGYVIFPGETVTSSAQCSSLSIPGTYYIHSFTGNCNINYDGIILDGQGNATITGNVYGASGATGQSQNGNYLNMTGGNGISLTLLNLNVTGNMSAGSGGNGGSNWVWWGNGGQGGNGGSLTITTTNLDLSNKSISAGSGGTVGDDGCGGLCGGNPSTLNGTSGNIAITYTGLTTNSSTNVYNAKDFIVNSYHNGPWDGVFDPKSYYYNDSQGNGGRTGDWGDPLNWYFDSGFTTPAGSIPLGFNNVVINNGHVTRNTAGSAVANTLTLNGSSTIAIPVTLTSGAVFGDSSSNTTTPATLASPQIITITITGTYASMPNTVISLPDGGSFSSLDVYNNYGSWSSTSTGATKFAQYLVANYYNNSSIDSAVANGNVVTVTIPYGSPLVGTWSGNAGLVEVPNTSGQNWISITSSADGTKLAAVAGQGGDLGITGYIYTSSGSGNTWTQRTSVGLRSWVAISSSADGTKLAAATWGGYVYTSIDSGNTWTERQGSGQLTWQAISYSRDGSTIVATTWSWGSGDVYISKDGGVTWNAIGPGNIAWQSVATNQDGTKIIVGSWDGNGGLTDIGTYTNGSWSWSTSMSGGNICGVSMSADGMVLTSESCSYGGAFYVSVDGGSSWTSPPVSGGAFCQSAESADGNTIAVSSCNDPGNIFLSKDKGSTWSEFFVSPLSNSYTTIGMSSDGSKISAAQQGGSIWITSSGGVILQTTQPASPASNGLGSITSNGQIVFNGSSTNNSLISTILAIFNGSSTNNGVFGAPALPSTFNNGLVGWWKLDGNLNDSSGNGNNGTISGSVSYVSGIKGSAASFNGSSYINLGSNSSLKVDQNEFSFSMWIKPHLTNDVMLFENSDTDWHGFFFTLNRQGIPGLDLAKPGIIDQLSPSYIFNIDTWYFITAVQHFSSGHPSYVEYFVNGNSIGTYQNSSNYYSSTGYNAAITKPYAGMGRLNGLMDDLAIWNRALTNQEITAIYKNGASGSYTNDLVFVGDNSNNNGTTTGTVTRLFTSSVSTIRNFITEGNRNDWIVIAKGTAVDISNAVYNTATNIFKAIIDPITKIAGTFFWGSNSGGQVVPQITVGNTIPAYTGDSSTKTIKWKPHVNWDTATGSGNCIYSYNSDFSNPISGVCSHDDTSLPRPTAGEHTIYMKGTDSHGDVSEISFTFFYDNISPLSITSDDATLALDEATRQYYYLGDNINFPLNFTINADLRGSATSTASSTGAGFTLTGDINAHGYNLSVENIIITGTTTSNGQGNGSNGGEISVYNSTVGYIVSNGANNPSGKGGNGGTVFVDPSVVIGVTSNGGDGSTGGGDGGLVTLLSTDSDIITANGGKATSCGKGGDSGEVSLIDSTYNTLNTEPGFGSNTGCPSVPHQGGISHPPVVIITPRPTPPPSASTVATVAKPSHTQLELTLANLQTITIPVNMLPKLALSTLPVFGSDTKGSFSFISPIENFITSPSTNDTLGTIKKQTPSLFSFLDQLGIATEQALVSLNVTPQKLTTTSIEGLFTIKGLTTKLAGDKSNPIYQKVTTTPGKPLTISLIPIDKNIVTGTFNGKTITFDSNNTITITAPSTPGTYYLKTTSSPIPLAIVVTSTSIPQESTATTTEIKPSTLWDKVWNWFTGK